MNSHDRPFTHIVVGVELSAAGDAVEPTSQRALGCALSLAQHLGGASVCLVHATGAEEHYHKKPGSDVWVHAAGVSDAGRAALERALGPFRAAGVDAALELPEERAWLAIVQTAKRVAADLVVVGKREPSGFDFDERRLGAVASQLLRRCPTAVWAVDPERAPLPKRILVATDLAEPMAARLICTGAAVARACTAEVQLMHAASLGWPRSALEDDAARRRRIDACRRDLADAATRALGEGVAELHVVDEAPAPAIVQCARDLDADLIVLGTSSHQLRHALLGHTAERVFAMSDRSLLALKPEGFRVPD